MVCEVIYAELASQFPTRSELDDFLSQNGLRLDHIGMEALFTASTVGGLTYPEGPGKCNVLPSDVTPGTRPIDHPET